MKRQFSDTLRFAFNSLISEIHTALPGQIESYNFTLKKATVKPLIKKKFLDGTVLSLPVISNVPVIFPSTNNFVFQFPLQRGDGCLLIFSERSMERFLSSFVEDVEPQDPRKFSISDGICIPGLFTFNNPGKVGEGTDVEIFYDNGTVNVQGSSNWAVLFNELKSKLDALETALNLHVHSGVTAGGASTGTPTISFDVDISNAQSQKVKLG